MKYEDLPIDQYHKKHDEYQARGLAIPDGTEVELTDWAIQNGITARKSKRNPTAIFIKEGNGKRGRIKVMHGDSVQPRYYWAGFWKEKKVEEIAGPF